MNAKSYNVNIDLVGSWLGRNFYFMIFHNTIKNCRLIDKSELRILQSLYELLLYHTNSNCICERMDIHPLDYLLNKTKDSSWEFRCRHCHAMELLDTIVRDNSVDMFFMIKKLPNIIEFKCSCDGRYYKRDVCNKCYFDQMIKFYLGHDIICRTLDIERKEMRTRYGAFHYIN